MRRKKVKRFVTNQHHAHRPNAAGSATAPGRPRAWAAASRTRSADHASPLAHAAAAPRAGAPAAACAAPPSGAGAPPASLRAAPPRPPSLAALPSAAAAAVPDSLPPCQQCPRRQVARASAVAPRPRRPRALGKRQASPAPARKRDHKDTSQTRLQNRNQQAGQPWTHDEVVARARLQHAPHRPGPRLRAAAHFNGC